MIKIISTATIALLLAACQSTTKQYDGFENAHTACYSFIYGENGQQRNYDKALKWCQIGNDDGYTSSRTLLAELYYLGYGVEKDINKASKLYFSAAIEGHPHAQLMLYIIFNESYPELSSAEQKELGLAMLRTSAGRGHKKAQDELAKYNKQHPANTE